jgi:hypothetical protein
MIVSLASNLPWHEKCYDPCHTVVLVVHLAGTRSKFREVAATRRSDLRVDLQVPKA